MPVGINGFECLYSVSTTHLSCRIFSENQGIDHFCFVFFFEEKKIKIKIIRETKLVYVCLYIYDICNNRTSIQSKLVTEMQKKIERCIIDKKNASIWLVILLQLTRNFSRTYFNSPITAIEVLDLLFLWLSERYIFILNSWPA